MLMAASCPSNSEAAETKRRGVLAGEESGSRRNAVSLWDLEFMCTFWGEPGGPVLEVNKTYLPVGYYANIRATIGPLSFRRSGSTYHR